MDTSTEFLFGQMVGALAAVEREMETSQPQSDGACAADSNSHSKDKDASGCGAVAASDAFSEALRTASEGLVLRLRLQNLYWLGDGFAFRRATGKVWGFVDGFSKTPSSIQARQIYCPRCGDIPRPSLHPL